MRSLVRKGTIAIGAPAAATAAAGPAPSVSPATAVHRAGSIGRAGVDLARPLTGAAAGLRLLGVGVRVAARHRTAAASDLS